MESAAALWPARNRVFSPRRVFGDFLRVQKVTRLSGRDNPRFGCHEVFHVFILLGSIAHFMMVYQVLLPL